MSMKKRTAIIATAAVLLTAFSIWNVYDFIQRGSRSTTAYLAIMFNVGAIIELIHLIRKEIQYRAGN